MALKLFVKVSNNVICDQRQYYLMYVSLLLGPGLVGVVRGIDEDAESKTSEVKRLSDIVPCYMTQLLLLGKFEYTGGPIFKVVLEC